MKNSGIPKLSAWWRFIVVISIIVFSMVACDIGSLPGMIGGSNPPVSRTPDEIRLNMASLTLLVGGTETLTATVLPADAANKSVNWNSSNSLVAMVASNGAVTGLSLGSATITATTEVGGKKATCTVSVTEAPPETAPAPTGISLFPPSLTLNIGDTDNLVVTVTPANASKDVNWKSENPEVVVVDSNGKITAKSAGTAAVYALTVVGGKQATSVITVNPPPLDVEQVNKYEVKTDSGNNINDRIKYSVSYGDIDYYYIHLGSMQHIPLFFYTAQRHDGMASTYSVSRTETTKESIEKTVTQSSQTTLGVVDTNTVSTTLGGKASAEISKKYTVNVNLGGISAGSEVAAKAAVEAYWSKVNTNSSSTSVQKTTSLTDTVKNGTEYTVSTQETRSWNFSKSDKAGWYRYTLFSASDVYLYVVRNRTKPNEIYYEFREHVMPDVYFWQLDYSETASFNKSDETRFGFNVSMLDNLPKTKSDITPSFEITFNSNGGSSVPKQTVPLNGTVTRPANPTMSGYTFDGWYKDSGYKNLYDFSTKVIDNITLYAKWSAIPVIPPSIITTDFISIRGREGEITVTDAGELKAPIDQVNFNVFGIDIATKKQEGYKTVSFYIRLDVREKTDGYQWLFLYSSPIADKKYKIAELKFEHSPKLDTNWWVHKEDELKFENISIDKFMNNEFVIRYDASGKGSDTWYNRDLSIQLVIKK